MRWAPTAFDQTFMKRILPLISIVALLSFPHMTTFAQTNVLAKGTLVVGILSIESSYANNTEQPATSVPDTLQFWIGDRNAWRIRTYATDHDIHPHAVGDLGKMKDRPIDFAREHISKHYGDVLASVSVLEFSDVTDTNAVQRVLAKHKLKGGLEVTKSGFAFWNPDGGKYRSQTRQR